MCGIFCAFYQNENEKSLVEDVLRINKRLLNNRGPDRQSFDHVRISNNSGILMYGTTLHMRGEHPTKQPLIRNGNLLLWNGEIFDGIEVIKEENDGQVLLNHLSNCICDEDILDIIAKIQGPYSFIYWQASSKKLWFGRDVLGRRSLLLLIDKSSFVMSSVAFDSQGEWQELPASGIYCLKVEEMRSEENDSGIEGGDMSKHLTLFPWLWRAKDLNGQSRVVSGWTDGDLFSRHISKQCFKSINVSRVGISCSISKLNRHHGDLKEIVPAPNLSDLETETRTSALERLLHHLDESVRKRTQDSSVPRLCFSCIKKKLDSSWNVHDQDSDTTPEIQLDDEICNHAKVAVLFSGGIDSLVLATLTDRYIPPSDPIDLLNVSFVDQNPRNNKDVYQAPDRITGIEGLKELKSINPNRTWNFVEIDIPLVNLQEQRQERIRHLIKPLDTVLDDSIGCAIWFAAQGHGHVRSSDDDDILKPYTSHSRVLILGMGADELFAGYSRHRMRFLHEGLQGLAQELEHEIQNISHRNMGRDDRIVSDHSKEARFPYLDEELVNFVLSLDMETKFDLRLPRGLGEKLLLRLLAKEIGLTNGATLHKRAIQFGSRIAKLESRNEKANHKCTRLKNNNLNEQFQ